MRRRSLIVAVGVCCVVISGLALKLLIDGRRSSKVGPYYSAIFKNDFSAAYELTCASYRQGTDLTEFIAEATVQAMEVGSLQQQDGLRGKPKVAYTILTGSRDEVKAQLPIEKLDGVWLPCPADDPLGTFGPA